MTQSVTSAEEQEQEHLVRKQGDAYRSSYDELMSEDRHDGVEIDDYLVTAAFEPAEGMYIVASDGRLMWKVPEPHENQHLEVIVRDRHDGRFVPGLDVRMLLRNGSDIVVDTPVPFIWHPFVFHYGINGHIPEEGSYSVEVRIARPVFGRHDEVRGRRYARDVQVDLGPLKLRPGRKEHGPE